MLIWPKNATKQGRSVLNLKCLASDASVVLVYGFMLTCSGLMELNLDKTRLYCWINRIHHRSRRSWVSFNWHVKSMGFWRIRIQNSYLFRVFPSFVCKVIEQISAHVTGQRWCQKYCAYGDVSYWCWEYDVLSWWLMYLVTILQMWKNQQSLKLLSFMVSFGCRRGYIKSVTQCM